MSRALKEKMVEELVHEIKDLPGCVVVSYEKLTTEEAQAFRARMRQDRIRMRIVKNSLAHLAVEKVGMGSLKDIISGPTAILFSRTDGVLRVSKAVQDWVRKSQSIKVRGGILDGRKISTDDVKKLAAIPSREALLSMTLCLVKGPMTNLAVLTKAPIEKTARLLKAVADKRKCEGEAATAGGATDGGAAPAASNETLESWPSAAKDL